MNNIFSFLGVVGTSFFSIWAFFKYVILGTYKLNSDASKRIVDKIEKNAQWKWILAGEHVLDPKYPDLYEAFVFLDGVPFFFSKSEKMMTAGWKGKEDYSIVSFFRWNRKKINSILKDEKSSNILTVSALIPGGIDRLGELSVEKDLELFLNKGTYEDIEKDVEKVATGELQKTSCLLHGSPGNGKTRFIKYLAKKYSMPINVIYLNPEYSNYDIVRMFSEVPRRSIVLMEDFDNYFHGRECSMKNDKVNFTFDSIINALDGVHNDYRGIVFAMTANDISKIDDALKSRPSRFKFVKEFSNPNDETRRKILKDDNHVEKTNNFSLDEVFCYKSKYLD